MFQSLQKLFRKQGACISIVLRPKRFSGTVLPVPYFQLQTVTRGSKGSIPALTHIWTSATCTRDISKTERVNDNRSDRWKKRVDCKPPFIQDPILGTHRVFDKRRLPQQVVTVVLLHRVELICRRSCHEVRHRRVDSHRVGDVIDAFL